MNFSVGSLRSLRLRAVITVVLALFLPLFLYTLLRRFDWAPDEIAQLTWWSAPLVLLLGLWLGWRIVAPVEALTRQVLEKQHEALPRPNLDLGRSDELGDLASGMNHLLGRLRERRVEEERMMGDLVHTMKSPVATVAAAAETLSRPELEEATRLRLATLLGQAARSMDETLSALLEIARAEAGMPQEPREPFELGGLVREIARQFSEDPRNAALRIELEASAIELRVSAVPARVEAALRSLLENACDFAREVVELRIRQEGNFAVLEVIDDGPGVAPEDSAQIFDRFYSTRRPRGGTGLGLALAKAIAEGHGGSLVYERSAERTRFRLALPA